jgi:hypothetical protein
VMRHCGSQPGHDVSIEDDHAYRGAYVLTFDATETFAGVPGGRYDDALMCDRGFPANGSTRLAE